jgi:hypothetical protein
VPLRRGGKGKRIIKREARRREVIKDKLESDFLMFSV